MSLDTPFSRLLIFPSIFLWGLGSMTAQNQGNAAPTGKAISCVLQPSHVKLYTGASIFLEVGLHNGSSKVIRYSFSDPQQVVQFYIKDANDKEVFCRTSTDLPPAYARGRGLDVQPGQDRFQKVNLKDWSCPDLSPGVYTVYAIWNFEDGLFENKEWPVAHGLEIPELKSNNVVITIEPRN